MSTESLRLEIMDAQRYDISKRRVSPFFGRMTAPPMSSAIKERSITIQTTATAGHSDTLPPLDDSNSASSDSSPPITDTWVDQILKHFSPTPSSSSRSSSPTNSPTPPSSTSSVSENEKGSNITTHDNDVIHCTDVFERDGYTTTRTIIRPTPPVSIFSRPSSPVCGISRPSSPIKFSTLNCIGSTDAFEEEVEHLTTLRQAEMNGEKTGISVRMHQERHVVVEERWREGIQAILYQRPFQEVVGRVEVV